MWRWSAGSVLLWMSIGCLKQTPVVQPTSNSCTGPETLNGYKDDDGCADELARLRVIVLNEAGKGLSGIEVWLPGLSKPAITDAAGNALFFELVPLANIRVSVSGNDTHQSQYGMIQLREGANALTLTMPTTIPADAQPTVPQPEKTP